jgi:excinuclease UvrABC helicase subunit UvrB
VTEEPPRPSARDLVRKRSRTYRAPETGRHHHIGAAPERQPVLGENGHSYVGTSPVQLAGRTVAQLREQADRARTDMAAAAQDLRFEDAAALRDDLERIEAELRRRDEPPPGP